MSSAVIATSAYCGPSNQQPVTPPAREGSRRSMNRIDGGSCAWSPNEGSFRLARHRSDVQSSASPYSKHVGCRARAAGAPWAIRYEEPQTKGGRADCLTQDSLSAWRTVLCTNGFRIRHVSNKPDSSMSTHRRTPFPRGVAGRTPASTIVVVTAPAARARVTT